MQTKGLTVLLCGALFSLTAGCSSEVTAGAAGAGIGALFQNTLAGAKADLKAREEALLKAYNEGVAVGAKQEDLDAIAKEIELNRRMQQGTQVGEQLLGVNWNDPKQTGMAFGNLIELGFILWGGKKLRQTATTLKGTQAGVNKFTGTHDPVVAGQLYDTIKEKLALNGVKV